MVSNLIRFLVVALILFFLLLQPLLAEDLSQSAGALTSDLPLENVLELPPASLSDPQTFDNHLRGHSLFHSSFRGVRKNQRPILGPHFVNDSCGACHVHAGRGSLILGKEDAFSSMVVKVGLRRRNSMGSLSPVPGVGEQLQEHSLSGARRYKTKLTWRYMRGSYPDGTPFTLRRPKLSFVIPKLPQSQVAHSLRMSPALVGMGLLEAIPLERLQELADPDDTNNDGISGRLNYVRDKLSGSILAGRFGFKATSPSLRDQIGTALLLDMGITNNASPRKVGHPELSAEDVDNLVIYQQLSGVPRFRSFSESRFIAGFTAFQAARCSDCHTKTHQTASTATPQLLASQTIHPFTDLLLHDMGRALSDPMRSNSHTSREWRTSPLWGLGLADITAIPPFGYLHDGRARTLEEAILWHAGEGTASRDIFMHFEQKERSDLIYFLKSL